VRCDFASGKERVDVIVIVLPLRLGFPGQPPAVHIGRFIMMRYIGFISNSATHPVFFKKHFKF
jgi:hypothetical protein